MGNYADTRDALKSRGSSIPQATQDIYNARGGQSGTGMSLADFSQKGDLNATDAGAASATQSVRRRGSAEQQRVGQDTRVREDASSGTGGAAGSAMGSAMAANTGAQPSVQQASQNPLWQGARQATDLASIQQRVLQSLTKPMQRGQ